MNHLRACIACQRHIRITETRCPFCNVEVPADRRSPPPRGNPARRLARAAAVATAATLGGVTPIVQLGACNNAVGPQVVTGADAYGAFPVEAAEPDVPDVSSPMDAPTDGDAGMMTDSASPESGSDAAADGAEDGGSADAADDVGGD